MPGLVDRVKWRGEVGVHETENYCPFDLWSEPYEWHYCSQEEAEVAARIGLEYKRERQPAYSFVEFFKPQYVYFVRPGSRANAERLYFAFRPLCQGVVERYLGLGARKDAREFLNGVLRSNLSSRSNYDGIFGRAHSFPDSGEGRFYLHNSIYIDDEKRIVYSRCAAYAVASEIYRIAGKEHLPVKISISWYSNDYGEDCPVIDVENLKPPAPKYL